MKTNPDHRPYARILRINRGLQIIYDGVNLRLAGSHNMVSARILIVLCFSVSCLTLYFRNGPYSVFLLVYPPSSLGTVSLLRVGSSHSGLCHCFSPSL